MSVFASGSAVMKMKKHPPEKIIELVKEEFGEFTRNGLDYIVEFEGNWMFDSVMSALEVLNPYVDSGTVAYWCDEGDEASAEFRDGAWREEWQEKYFPSDLPNNDISSTPRVAEILNTIAGDMMDCSDSSEAIRVLLHKCRLTDSEIEYYGLNWLKDLDD